jgi:hypothetical protein
LHLVTGAKDQQLAAQPLRGWAFLLFLIEIDQRHPGHVFKARKLLLELGARGLGLHDVAPICGAMIR